VLGEQTTSTGRYALGVDPAAMSGRIMNLEVAAFGAGAMTARSFTRRRVAGSGGTVLAVPFGPAQIAPQVVNLRLRSAAPDNPCGAAVFGSLVFKRNLGAKNVVVGGTYSKASNITANFSYLRGQSSSLGVGLSGSSTYANFHESGTYGISSRFREDFAPFRGVGSHLHRTEFRYGLFRWFCSGPHGGGSWANWQPQPTDSAGGATSPGTSSAFRATYCVFQEPNSRFTLDTTAAYTFAGGVSIKDAIGIDLTAQTGYDEEAVLSYYVNGNPGRWMCGKSNNPGGEHPPAGLVVAH